MDDSQVYNDFAELHLKIHGKKIEDGFYKIRVEYLNSEFENILDQGGIGWTVRGQWCYCTINT